MYYNANNELKASLIGYNLTHEEMQTAISNQSFDGFWDKIYYLDLEEIEIIEATPKSSKVSARRRRYHECDGIFNCDANGSNRWTRYGNNSGYGGYSGSGSSYSLPPLSNLPPQVAAALQAAGVFLGVNYNNRAPAGYGYNYTSPVRYFSVGDLTIPNTNSNSTPTPFNRRYFYYFPELKNKITTYYNQVYVSYINSYMTSTQTTLEDHNNKQRFITQFFKFLYKLRTENYSAFNYLANNPQKTVAVFNFLAENNSFNAYEFAKSTITALMSGIETDNGITDFNDNEPNIKYAGTIHDFKDLLDNSPSKVGAFKNYLASEYLKSLGNTKFNFKQMRPLPTQTGFFNTKKGRYIYTKKGGWIDMAHFMFYAGKAYSYKLNGSEKPVGEAVQDGYKQEWSDFIVAKHSAYSYEDLPSDKFGADFAVNHFDKNSSLTFSEQLLKYFNNVLKSSIPSDAPNYNQIPSSDSKNNPIKINKTTNPLFTK